MAAQYLFLILALAGINKALVSKDGTTGRLPAMGWNSWNEYACNINESIFLNVGKSMVSLGLKDAGYNYVNIDDCWSDKNVRRDSSTGKIVPDRTKFPKGINGLADEMHKLGLKLGIYSDAGTSTCAGYAGSLGHEELDAKTFAEWGIDYLKYDNCNVPSEWNDQYDWRPENWLGGPPREHQSPAAPAGYDYTKSKTFTRYKAMRDALLSTNRTIEFSQCAWGHARIDQWGNTTGHSWRMFSDIQPQWTGKSGGVAGLTAILNHAAFFSNTSGFWGHSDWDMLEVGNGGLTYEENRSHFALWAALKSPLIIGTRLTSVTPGILQILTNKPLIAFNQDAVFGAPALPYKWGVNPDRTWNQTHPAEYWSGRASSGMHVFVLNSLGSTQTREVVFAEVPGLGAPAAKDGTYSVYDLWTGETRTGVKGSYKAVVKSHDTMAIRIT